MLVYFEGITNEFFQMVDLFVAFDREIVKHTSLTSVKGYPEELLLNETNLRNG